MTLGELNKKYTLPKMDREFILEKTKGDLTGLEFEGAFKVKTMTLDEEANFNGRVDSFLYKCTDGFPQSASEGLTMYAKAKFYLKQTVVTAPEWWYDFEDHPMDINVITKVYFLALGLKNELEEALLQDKKELVGG